LSKIGLAINVKSDNFENQKIRLSTLLTLFYIPNQILLMAKEKKFTLDELKVDSFATKLTTQQMSNTKGGIFIIRGRRYTYSVRWTAIDVRIPPESNSENVGGGK
jgi:hypothetical protein